MSGLTQIGSLSEDYPYLLELVMRTGRVQESRIGKTVEAIGLLLGIDDPENCVVARDGMSRDFMDMEIAQLLAGEYDEELLRSRIPRAADLITPYTSYGPRTWLQLCVARDELRDSPDSRRAVVYIGRELDLEKVRDPDDMSTAGEMPCTMSWQFLVREDRLHMIVVMRSWDLVWGLSYDVPSFVAVQMSMAADLGLALGRYTHLAGSAHIYERHWGMNAYSNSNGALVVPHIGDSLEETRHHASSWLDSERRRLYAAS